MKFRCHIPKLLDFALYAACDDIVKHGKQGLKVAMPRPLYYRAIMAFAEKNNDSISTMKAYNIIRCCGIPDWPEYADVDISLRTNIELIDHVCFDDVDEIDTFFFALTVHADENVDGVVQCIHRFATRCDHHGKHQLSMDVMTHTLNRPYHTLPKVIRDVMIQYGAKFDRIDRSGFLSTACQNGMIADIQWAISHGYALQQENLGHVVESGCLDAVKFVISAPNIRLALVANPEDRVKLRSGIIDVSRSVIDCGTCHY